MSRFFAKFPSILYDVARDGSRSEVLFTNLLLRMKVLDAVKHNVFAYYDYPIRDGDTIHILAEKYYGDQEYAWIIALANDFADPLFDWPMTTTVFNNYIIAKYGSIATAQTTIHHYEKVITRIVGNTTDIQRLEIDETAYDLLDASSYEAHNLTDGSTVQETITKTSVTCYDWEDEQNENRRQIKMIKKDYLNQILTEFNAIVFNEGNTSVRSGLRSLR